MLLYPPIDEIKLKADSRYSLVIMTAKRARDLVAGKPKLVDTENNVPISIAAEEVIREEIGYRQPDPPAEEAV